MDTNNQRHILSPCSTLSVLRLHEVELQSMDGWMDGWIYMASCLMMLINFK